MALQLPNLDDRTFDQLVAEATARIPVYTPEWTNFNASDPGMTVVQLFAFLTENLLYRANQIPDANRLKFLNLLNIPLQPATPGQGFVVFTSDRGPVQSTLLDKGAEVRAGKVPFRTRTPVSILPVTAAVYYKAPQTLDEATKKQYQTLYQTFLNQPFDQLQYYKTTPLDAPQPGKPLPVVNLADTTNGPIDRALWVALVGPQNVPSDTVRAAIAGQTVAFGIYPDPRCKQQVLPPVPAPAASQTSTDPGLVFEIAAPDPDPANPGSQIGIGPARYKRLTVEYADSVLDTPGIVQVTLPAYEELLLWSLDPEEDGAGAYPPLIDDQSLAQRIVTWIRIRLPLPTDTGTSTSTAAGGPSPATQQARLSWVGVNAARVTQAVPVQNERLGVGTGAPDQTFRVANTPVILDTTGQATSSAPAGAFVLEVQTDTSWETWQRTDDLYAAKDTDKVYLLDPQPGLVTFGSGHKGMRAPLNRVIRVSYEYGGGPQGQVPIGAINKCPQLPGSIKVQNPVATWGAGNGDTVADGERNISHYLQNRDRLVTANDFHDIVLRTPGVDVGRVEVLPLFNPDLFVANGPPQQWPGTVTILVVPRFDPAQPDAPIPDRLFLQAICAWIEPRRLVTTEIYVRGPDYVKIWVSVGIVSMPGQSRQKVANDVQTAIKEYLSPLTGGPPVVGAASNDPCAPAVTTTDPCPTPVGVGWPLSQDVRVQDLEAVATRVAGVRYIDSINLATVDQTGAVQTGITSVPIAGLQLPQLAGIGAREGSAEDPATLLGQQPPPDPTNFVPVPVLPAKC